MYLGNRAIWVLVGAVAFYWLVVALIGGRRALDATDIISMVVASALVLRLAHHAFDRLLRGGDRPEWRVTMGMTLFWLSMFVSSAWGFMERVSDFPAHMMGSPINGFFHYGTLGAGLLMLSALSDGPTERNHSWFPLWVVVFGMGILVGAVGLRLMGI